MTGDRRPSHVLALTPSTGRGGGIEAYVRGVVAALQDLGISVEEIAFLSEGSSPGSIRKMRYLGRVIRPCLRLRRTRADILCFHPGLLPAAFMARTLLGGGTPITAFFYGIDIWGAGDLSRWLSRRSAVRPVTISSFSAGAMAEAGPTLLLPAGVEAKTYTELLAEPRCMTTDRGLVVLSVFRLDAYVQKGGPELVTAVARLREEGHSVSLTVAGHDAPSDRLEADLQRHTGWMRVVRSPTRSELVDLYRQANVFVLASRQHSRPYAFGEGFGIVLAEAALAALPVVAPANDGSRDAFIPGLTGLRPVDQSVEALTDTLRWMADHPRETYQMGTSARVWAERAFDPSLYGSRVGSVLWGHGAYEDWLGLELSSSPGGTPGSPGPRSTG